MGLLNFIKRPFVGDQTTARDAFQQYQGYAFSGVNGNGGQGVRRSMFATSPAGIAPGPTHKLNDPSATGNDAYSIGVQPLTDNRNI